MINYLRFLSFLLFLACGSFGARYADKYLKENEIDTWVYLDVEEFDQVKFYIVNIEQLSRAQTVQTLTYLGSNHAYHYFQVWNKLSLHGEANFFALPHEFCEVTNPKTVKDEISSWQNRATYYRWRGTKIIDGKCVVDYYK